MLQVFWQASWSIWAQVHAYLHGLGWMGVQLWRTEWLPNPIKTQAFTRVPEGPRQVTPKLSCSLYWHSSSCPWGTHPGGLTRCHNPPLPLLSSTADCTRGVQHFDHKTPTTSGLFLSSTKTTDDARKTFCPFWLWASFPCSVQSATEGNVPPWPTAIHLFLRFYNR